MSCSQGGLIIHEDKDIRADLMSINTQTIITLEYFDWEHRFYRSRLAHFKSLNLYVHSTPRV